MIGRVKTHQELLKALLNLKPKYRDVLLKSCGEDEINCISECIFNVLKGKVALKDKDKSKLKKQKNILRKVVSKVDHKQRKRLIVQKGGAFLPVILGAVLSTLLSSLTK